MEGEREIQQGPEQNVRVVEGCEWRRGKRKEKEKKTAGVARFREVGLEMERRAGRNPARTHTHTLRDTHNIAECGWRSVGQYDT